MTVPESFDLIKGQLRFMKQYYDIIAVSSDGKCFDEMIKKQEVRGVKINMTRQITPLKDIISLIALIFFFFKEKPDVVHTHTPKAGTLGMFAAWIARVPIRLHTVAGLPLLVASGRKRKMLEIVEKLTYACATKVYPNSFGLQQILLENKFTCPRKLKVIANGSSNGIDTSYYNRTEILELEAAKYRKENIFTFIFIGRIVHDKGINELVHAFCELCTDKNIRLILVGSFEENLDPVSPDVRNNILSHEKIEYVGEQQDVRPFIMAADILVFPSYREGFPNVVMETGALGVASIVTDINGCNEIIISSQNGIVIPPRNKDALYEVMKYCCEHVKEVKRMGEMARALIVARFEQQMVWAAIKKEYEEVISNSSTYGKS